MKFSHNNDADCNGTYLVGEISLSPQKLTEIFGEPMEGDGYKISMEWLFEDSEGNVYTLYDWKETSLYDYGLPHPFEVANRPLVNFHIGGHRGTNVAEFGKWLKSQTGK